MRDVPPAPPGYVRFEVGTGMVTAHGAVAGGVRIAMRAGTLHGWAGAQPGAVAMQGRAISWATRLPAEDGAAGAGPEVVVRHAWHGGLLRAVTGDRWWGGTRAPRELAIALRLAAAGVPTPELLAYATYPAGFGWSRADVMTRRLPAGADFVAAWQATTDPAARTRLLEATATLLRALRDAGAWHADLNLKNVYVAEGGARAWVLDVDRIAFLDHPPTAGARNLARLSRSWENWRTRHGLDLDPGTLTRLRALAGAAA